MPELDLGEKRACSDCGILFFDLNLSPPVCPKCGNEVRLMQHRAAASLQKTDVAGEDVVDDAADETKQEEDEFDEDTDAVTLGPSPKPTIEDEALEGE